MKDGEAGSGTEPRAVRAGPARPPATIPEAGVGIGRSFGTFGELLQGVLPDRNREFLVTFPIDLWSTAVFHHDPNHVGVIVRPPAKRKARRVAELALVTLGGGGGGRLDLTSDLPEGKGLASSSADLVATARAVAAACGRVFDAASLETLLRAVEPSDGVMYDEVVAFFHREVRLHHRLGTLPPLVVLGHDEGGQVDTISYNRVPKPFTARDKSEYIRLLTEIGTAIVAGDLREIGRIATRSAVLNAKLRPRRALTHLRAACGEVDGFGVVMAHSGTMLGILLSADDPEVADKAAYVRRCCVPLGGDVRVYRSLA